MTGYLPPEGRGEWVASDGKQYHRTAAGDEHVGSWLTCDACNPVAVVKAAPDSRAAELRAEYYAAKEAKDAAEERFKTVQGALKTALSEASGEALRSALHVPGYQPLTLTYGERWTVDSKRLKAEQPVTYAAYAKLGSSWTLQESKGQQS
jgi:hypothetical protein